MGLNLTKEEAREKELNILIEKADAQYCALQPAVAAEVAAGIPRVAGTNRALSAATHKHLMQLRGELVAVFNRRIALSTGQLDVPPMPEPTPPLQLVAVPLAEASPPEQPCGSCVQPRTPMGSSSSSPHRLRGSRGSEGACAASGAEGREAAPLLAARALQVPSAGLSTGGLRQRPEHLPAPA